MIILLIIFSVFIIWFQYDLKIAKRKLKFRTYPLRYGQPQFFNDGTDLFPALFEDIRMAQSQIDIVFYIIKKGQLSEEMLQLLINKAGAGVQVRLLLDWFGCLRTNRKLVKELRRAGGEIRYSHVPSFPHIFLSLLVRNHQKIAVIDENHCYVGGFNVGDEYIHKSPKLSPWKDYHLKISGDIGYDFAREFEDMWYGKITIPDTKQLQNEATLFSQAGSSGDIQLIPYEAGAMERQFLAYIGSAKTTILIGTPYFIPSKHIMQALEDALRRGVALEVILPVKEDHFFVKEAAFPYMKKLLPLGAVFHHFENGFYHAKFIAIDEQFIEVGTANFNMRSFFLNDEANCRFTNPATIADFKKMIAIDIAHSSPITLSTIAHMSIWKKIKTPVAKWLAPYL